MKPRVVGHEAETASVSEEHTSIDVAGECELAVGDTVELVPGYAPTTVNLHAVYHVVRDGSVVDVWPSSPATAAIPPSRSPRRV